MGLFDHSAIVISIRKTNSSKLVRPEPRFLLHKRINKAKFQTLIAYELRLFRVTFYIPHFLLLNPSILKSLGCKTLMADAEFYVRLINFQ